MKVLLQNLIKKILKHLTYFWLKFIYFLVREKISQTISSRHYKKTHHYTIRDEVKSHTDRLLSFNDKDRIIKCLKTHFPCSFQETIESADLICKHIFNLFGREYSIGTPIIWHKDFVSGHEWPLKFYLNIKIINLSDNYDIRIPWELNSFYHAVTLGKAYWFTEDEKYLIEFISQVQSWVADNPISKGINWNCAMMVAIRAINLIWAYCFFIESKKLSAEFHALFSNLILAHGRHIFKNLENKSSVKANHYIGNLIGLLYISLLFPIFKYSRRWKTFALKELIHAMEEQVYDDGTNFEGSIPYHRLVTEMFLHAAFLLTTIQHRSSPNVRFINYRLFSKEIFGPQYVHKLEKMCEYILSYTKPDGLAPQIGDNDNGRLIKLGSNNNNVNDHRHVLALAGEFFDRDDFRIAGQKYCEDAIWLWGGHLEPPVKEELIVDSRAYADAGIYIMRKDRDYLIVRCGKLGTDGKGSHTHNDNLGFELCADGTTYIVDPGTFTYSGDFRMRNLLRSTEYHNTLCIDGIEQHLLSEKDMFLLRENSDVTVLAWKTNKKKDLFLGEVKLSLDTQQKITHRREIQFNKHERNWKVKDTILGTGIHELVWNFHANHDISINIKGGYTVFESKNGSSLRMSFKSGVELSKSILDGWVSPSYNIKRKAPILQLATKAMIPLDVTFTLSAQ